MTDRTDTAAPEIAVGAVVVHEGSLLMVRRGREPAKGLWTIPGGRVRRGEYLTDAAAREVREETGLDVEVGRLLGVFEVVSSDDHFVVLDHACAPKSDGEPVPGSDADDARWVSFERIGEMDCTPRLIEMLMAWGVFQES